MTGPAATVPGHRPIDKQLFEASLQCPKRLFLDAHHPDARPEPSERRRELVEIGRRLVEIAAEPFPKGPNLAELDIDAAVEKTAEFVGGGRPGVLFHGAFRGGGAEARVDIVLSSAPGELDLFEIKAGSSVKERHVLDVALQIHAIEANGYAVKSVSVLHLDPKYEHKGGKTYPAQKLFRSVDVTERARQQLDAVATTIAEAQKHVDDEGTLATPTGTHCRTPLPCDHLPSCLKDGPEHPLVELPQLTPEQEEQFRGESITELSQIHPRRPGLSILQRRALKSVQTRKLVVEPFVADELRDVEFPLACVDIGWHLDVLPRFENARPWEKIPFAWSMRLLSEDGTIERSRFVSTTSDDPRGPTLESLAAALDGAGTMLVYERDLDDRLRHSVALDPELEKRIDDLLQIEILELDNLVRYGVYHEQFANTFDLQTVFRLVSEALSNGEDPLADAPTDLEFVSAEDVHVAYRRILNSRTRAATRDKLGTSLEEWFEVRSAQVLGLYRMLSRG